MPSLRFVARACARMRVCDAAGLPWPDDLTAEIREIVEDAAERPLRIEARNELVRLSGICLAGANDSAWDVAGKIAVELRALARAQRPEHDAPARNLLRQAHERADVPSSQRQLYRILLAANDDG